MTQSLRSLLLSMIALSLLSASVLAQIDPVGVTSSSKNAQQVALLHWYDANLTTVFSVGAQPEDIAYD